MNWKLKNLQPLENNYELIFGVLVIPITATIYIGISFLPVALMPTCHFHAATGLPCPTCGATRALHLLSSGDFTQAWLMQPLLITTAICAAIYSLYSFIVVLGKLPRIRVAKITKKDRRLILTSCITLFLLNWLYLTLTGI